MQNEHRHGGMGTETEVMSWCAFLFSQLQALQATENAKQAWVSEDLCAHGKMCSDEKDHRGQKVFHTHYSYLSSSWKAKKSQVEGMTASDPVKREACC